MSISESSRTFLWFLCRVTLLLVSSLDSVSCQDTVEGFVGEDVLLPCSYDTPLSADVFWRNKDDGVLLDIVKGSENSTSQGLKYRGRVFSFPNQYKEGNFSIIMKNLQKDDADTYDCYIPWLVDPRKIKLTVSDKPPGKATEASPLGGGAAGLNLHQVALLSAVCLLLCF